jgi:membrane protein
VVRVPDTPGYRFALAVALLRELQHARAVDRRGLGLHELAGAVRVDPLQVEPVLDLLIAMDWVARLDEEGAQRHVLLIDAPRTLARPLINGLLLGDDRAAGAFRRKAGLDTLKVSELLE